MLEKLDKALFPDASGKERSEWLDYTGTRQLLDRAWEMSCCSIAAEMVVIPHYLRRITTPATDDRYRMYSSES